MFDSSYMDEVRAKNPLVHLITNYVTVNDCANVAICAGGSPIMTDEMKDVVDKVLALDGPVFTEIFTDTVQVWEPKSGARRNPDGSLFSPPLEDLAPFLPREELKRQMFIPLVDEK